MTHPAVVECAITGVPDPIRGMVVKATVVPVSYTHLVWGKLYGQWFAGATVFVFDHEKFTADKIMRQIENPKVFPSGTT